MGQYVCFRVPDMAWDGLDYLYNLIELKPNDLQFALIKARNMEQARRKYYDEFYFPKNIGEDKYLYAGDRLVHILEDYDENNLIERYGEADGKIIWNMIGEDEADVSPEIAKQTVTKLSDQTIYELCFEVYEMDIAVSAIDYISK